MHSVICVEHEYLLIRLITDKALLFPLWPREELMDLHSYKRMTGSSPLSVV